MEASQPRNLFRTTITIILSIVFAAVFMWLAVKDMDFTKIKSAFLRANYWWIAISAIFGLLAYWLRAVRWNLLLEPLGYRVSNKSSLWSISFGYLMNLTIPRSGELARATALYGAEGVAVEKSFGTIILERVVDLACMMLFLCLTLFFKYEALLAFYRFATQESAAGSQNGKALWIWLILGAGLLSTVLFFVFRKKLEAVALFSKIYKIADGLWLGVSSIFKLKNPLKFILYSLAIWICYYLAAYVVCFALPETSDFGITDGFFIIVVGTLGMMVPASGGIGAFHYALKIGVGALFLSTGNTFSAGEEAGLSYAFLSHTLQMVIMLVMGIIAIPALARMRQNR